MEDTTSVPHQFLGSLALSQAGTVCTGTVRDADSGRTRGIRGEGGEESSHDSLVSAALTGLPWKQRLMGRQSCEWQPLLFTFAINGSAGESNNYVTYVTLVTPDLNPVWERHRDEIRQRAIRSDPGSYKPSKQPCTAESDKKAFHSTQ